MSKEILGLIDALSNVKGIAREVVFKAAEEGLKEALMGTIHKKYQKEIEIHVFIDRQTGKYSISRAWVVVDDPDIAQPDIEITLTEAKKKQANILVGERIFEPVESIEFGRIVSRTAKQSIMKKIREAETAQMAESFKVKIGELLSGVVSRVTRDHVVVDLGSNIEGIFLRDQLLPREAVRSGDRLLGYLYDVRSDMRGAQLFLSRTRPEMLKELFRREVPEISELLIDIKAVAREPGVRAKIAVKTNDGRIDPIGACVGMRGTRVQAVSSELGGERIDIILWHDNPAQLVINAMAPAEVSSIVVDEEARVIDAAVEDSQLSLAIGKNGQNVRLASQLTDWEINVLTKAQAQKKHQKESQKLIHQLVKDLDVDEDLAKVLIEQGFVSIEAIAYVPPEELLSIEGFDDEIVDILRSRAKDVLLSKVISGESENAESLESLDKQKVSTDLLSINGMTEKLAEEFISKGIVTREDLAEQGVSDLLDITDQLEAKKAAELIMAARAHWFATEKK